LATIFNQFFGAYQFPFCPFKEDPQQCKQKKGSRQNEKMKVGGEWGSR